ncbi:enoyl-CoA hydratase-related protein [Streptomyces sp. NPDC048441]|uniref:enoyl-CoA hydratase-related protein n=1 Tax=Streptomyces sp. NPDC048441 TaxID=3365552 RepID=UPI00371A479D
MARRTHAQVEHLGRITRITLTRPADGNTLGADLLAELGRALDEAEAAADCRIIQIRGQEGTFCTGLDFTEALAAAHDDNTGTDDNTDADVRESARVFHALLARLTTIPRLTVATVDGQALGGGVGLAAACDVVQVSDRAAFALPEALWGLLPCVVLPFLIRRVGVQRAYAMTLTTLPVDAVTACSWGLADERYEDGRDPLLRLAFRMGRMPESTVGDIKRYFGRLAVPPTVHEELAVGELARLLAAPAARARITQFATDRERPRQSAGRPGEEER